MIYCSMFRTYLLASSKFLTRFRTKTALTYSLMAATRFLEARSDTECAGRHPHEIYYIFITKQQMNNVWISHWRTPLDTIIIYMLVACKSACSINWWQQTSLKFRMAIVNMFSNSINILLNSCTEEWASGMSLFFLQVHSLEIPRRWWDYCFQAMLDVLHVVSYSLVITGIFYMTWDNKSHAVWKGVSQNPRSCWQWQQQINLNCIPQHHSLTPWNEQHVLKTRPKHFSLWSWFQLIREQTSAFKFQYISSTNHILCWVMNFWRW